MKTVNTTVKRSRLMVQVYFLRALALGISEVQQILRNNNNFPTTTIIKPHRNTHTHNSTFQT